ncbi:MAG: hypothetical protein GY696_21840 [Gammaproteobacteria bacterium]|nr:hypothetical protein [Gammaproteobacteria bacterium]
MAEIGQSSKIKPVWPSRREQAVQRRSSTGKKGEQEQGEPERRGDNDDDGEHKIDEYA